MSNSQDQSPPLSYSARKCFHCGRPGHKVVSCPDFQNGVKRDASGQDAFETYLEKRENLRQKNGGKTSNNKAKGKMFYYRKMKEWTKKEIAARKILRKRDCKSDDRCCDYDTVVILDPITFLLEKDSTSEIAEESFEEIKNGFRHSHREYFSYCIESIGENFYKNVGRNPKKKRQKPSQGLSSSLRAITDRNKTDHEDRDNGFVGFDIEKDNWENFWQELLTAAVKDGEPANFSNPSAIKTYAVDKLTPRCRQLHHLIMDYNYFSNKIRTLLLPEVILTMQPTSNSNVHIYSPPFVMEQSNKVGGNDKGRQQPLRVCSIGGGPGFDHVSFCLVANYLFQMQSQPSSSNSPHKAVYSLKQKVVKTEIFDLYSEDWMPLMICLEESLLLTLDLVRTNEWAKNVLEVSSFDRKNDFIGQMTIHHCDLRKALDEKQNRELKDSIRGANIICFQFVLHENASFLLQKKTSSYFKSPSRAVDEDEMACHSTLQTGAVMDILLTARVGTFILCTDSENTLWPTLIQVGKECGWIFLCSSSDKAQAIVLGPKSYLILERVKESRPLYC